MSLLNTMKDAVNADPAARDRELRETYFKTEILPLLEEVSVLMKTGQEVAAERFGVQKEAVRYRSDDGSYGTSGGEARIQEGENIYGPDHIGVGVSIYTPRANGEFWAEDFSVSVLPRNDRVPHTDSWSESPQVKVSSFPMGERVKGDNSICSNLDEVKAAFLNHMNRVHSPQDMLEIVRRVESVRERENVPTQSPTPDIA